MPSLLRQSLFMVTILGILCGAGGCAALVAEPTALEPVPIEQDPNIVRYKQRLERKLMHRYNNTPEFAGKIAAVHLVHTRPPRRSVDDLEVQAEFSQLVYDKWGERVPALEKEYYVVTFGRGAPKLIRTNPSIDVGLYVQGGYSEQAGTDTGLLGSMLPNRKETESAVSGQLRAIEQQQLAPSRSVEEAIPVLPPAKDALMPSAVHEAPRQPGDIQGMAPPAMPEIPSAEVHGMPNWLDEIK